MSVQNIVLACSSLHYFTVPYLLPVWPQFCLQNLSNHYMAEDGEEGDELPCVDHVPLNEGAVGKRVCKLKKNWLYSNVFFFLSLIIIIHGSWKILNFVFIYVLQVEGNSSITIILSLRSMISIVYSTLL